MAALARLRSAWPQAVAFAELADICEANLQPGSAAALKSSRAPRDILAEMLLQGEADIGIAIGAGTDVAIESAGIVLASSDPRGVAKIVTLSKKTYSKMVQNLAWATGYNALAIPLAAGVTSALGFVLSPAFGAVLMSLSTIVVAINAQFLRKVRL